MKRLMQLCNLGYFQFFPFKFMSYFLFDKLIFLKSEFCQLFLNKEILFSRGFDVCVFLSHECIFEFPSMEISLMVGRALKNQFSMFKSQKLYSISIFLFNYLLFFYLCGFWVKKLKRNLGQKYWHTLSHSWVGWNKRKRDNPLKCSFHLIENISEEKI